MESKGHRPLIVVGVDGSESSRYALRWAARQAECADADVRAVMAWHLPEIYSYEPRDYEADALGALDDVVKETLGSNPRVPVVTQVVAGDAASPHHATRSYWWSAVTATEDSAACCSAR